jgi:hypothetical protein
MATTARPGPFATKPTEQLIETAEGTRLRRAVGAERELLDRVEPTPVRREGVEHPFAVQLDGVPECERPGIQHGKLV